MKKPIFLLISLTLLLIPVAAQEVDVAGEWTMGAQMATARTEIASVLIEGKIYVGGGLLPFWEGHPSFEVYDIEADSWKTLAPMPIGLHHYAMDAVNGIIYVSGGWTAPGSEGRNDKIYRYNPEADEWSQATLMPDYRMAHQMLAIDGKLYLVGGMQGRLDSETDEVWSYDPAADEWETDLTPLPTMRDHAAAVVADNKIYVISGRDNSFKTLSVMEVYDPAADEWETLSEVTTQRGGHAAAVLDGQIHVLGGEETSNEPPAIIKSHEVYDIESDAWLSSVDLPRWGLHGVTAEAFEGKLYVIGGSIVAGGDTANGAIKQVLIFTPQK